jgi:hypothetical protein
LNCSLKTPTSAAYFAALKDTDLKLESALCFWFDTILFQRKIFDARRQKEFYARAACGPWALRFNSCLKLSKAASAA